MATADEYAAWIIKNQGRKGTPEFDTVAKAYQEAKADKPVEKTRDQYLTEAADEMPWYKQAAAGVGKAIVDTGRGIGQLVGAVSRQDVADSRENDKALMNTGAGLTGNIAGNVGMMLAPGGALKLAGTALKAPAVGAVGGALLAPRTIGAAVGTGAAMGALQPSVSTSETMQNTGIGAAGGAAVPLLVKAGQAVKAAAEPFYEAGRNQIMGRALNRVAGADAPAAADRLRAAGAPYVGAPAPGEPARKIAGEIVPGSTPSVGEASGNAGIASLERAATAIEPEVTVANKARQVANNDARVAQVQTVAGDEGKREFFDQSRKATANQLYQDAYDAGVDLRRNASTGQFLTKTEQAGRRGEITKLMSTPAMQDAAKEAANLMRNDPNLKGKLLDPAGSVQGLDYTRRALSDMIGDAPAGSNKQRILKNLRDRLDTTLDTISPKYAEARKVFQEMSKPINQMDIGAELLEKGVNKVTGTLEPGKFINNLTDKTAANATGFKPATLAGTLDNAQMNKLNAVKEDLQRQVTATNSAGGPGSDTVKKLAYSNFIDAAGVPTWLRNFAPTQIAGNLASRGADALYGRANGEIASQLAQLMSDPAKASQLMRLARQPGNEKLLQLISRGGSAVGLAGAPALANAQKQ